MTDFGLARAAGTANLVPTGEVGGTLRYMAPERLEALDRLDGQEYDRSDAQVDGRTDIYSLGLTLHELLRLEPAFVGGTVVELTRQIREDDPPPLRSARRPVPRDLEFIVKKAVAKEPDDRFGSASEMAGELGALPGGAAAPIAAPVVG